MGDLFAELEWRGLVHQVTDPGLASLLDQGGMTAYTGFDPSSPSLGVGNLQAIINLARLQRGGHRPVVVAGGGTGLIGDPSGKSEERNLLTDEVLRDNLHGIRGQLERFLDFSPSAGGGQAKLVDNGDWLRPVGLLEFLRDTGKHFTVNSMIAKDSVQSRLTQREHGISFTEFTYMLLQAYDYLHLFDTEGCTLQLGGSDQWGNITAGIELIRRARSRPAYGLTAPLIVKPDGTKFGKTETGNVWLDADRTSPYALFQFFIRVDDGAVGDYLRRFTFLSRDEILELDAATATHPERREAARALARAVTTLVHGPGETAKAERAAAVLFSEEISELDEATLLSVFADAPSTSFPHEALHDGLVLVDALVQSGLESSKGSARRAIEQGGVYLNNRKITTIDAEAREADALHGRYVILRRGRKDHHLLRFG